MPGVALLAATINMGAENETLMIGRFSARDLTSWETKPFQSKIRYATPSIRQSGQQVLFADSQNATSGLYREIWVDLNHMPFLNWSWQVDHVLEGIDERSKTGDDYSARVYV